MLGIDRAATDTELHNGYLAVTGFLADVPEMLDEDEAVAASLIQLQSAVESAFAVLMDPDRRGVYDRVRCEATRSPGWQAPAQVVFQGVEAQSAAAVKSVGDPTMARVLDMRGRQYMARNEFDRAEKVLSRAVEIAPANAEYRLSLGWAIFCNADRHGDGGRIEIAREHLEEACVALPWSSLARYRMSQYWRHVGHQVQYRREIEATLRSEPEHYAANRELQEMKREERRALQADKVEPNTIRQGLFASPGRLLRH